MSVVVTVDGGNVTFTDPNGNWPSPTLMLGDKIDLTMGEVVLFARVAKARIGTEMRRRPSGAVHLIKSHFDLPDGEYVRTWCDFKDGFGLPLNKYAENFPSCLPRCLTCRLLAQNP